jgi:membrane protein implicated in regulation of membrane protease activity
MEIKFDGTYDRRMFMYGLGILDDYTVGRQVLRWLLPIVLLFGMGLSVYDWVLKGAVPAGLTQQLQPAFIFLLLVYYLVAPYARRWNKTRKSFEKTTSRRMIGRASAEGIVIGPVSGKTARFRWDRFMRSARRGEYLALLTLDGSMALFHRSFFKDGPDWQHFLKLVDQRVMRPK